MDGCESADVRIRDNIEISNTDQQVRTFWKSFSTLLFFLYSLNSTGPERRSRRSDRSSRRPP